jgi:hypothetical protein
MPLDYEYDVFFSYKRHRLTLDWMSGVHKRLQLWLQEEIPDREVKVFVDEDNIETGDCWPEKLKDALKLSRCMVCVWSPSYFRSSWCVSEWMSFLEREKRIKVRSHGLIAPIKFHDGEHFRVEAQNVQWTDVAPYTSSVPAFWTSQRAIELEDALKALAHSVSGILKGAPPFEPDWPIVEATALEAHRIRLARL